MKFLAIRRLISITILMTFLCACSIRAGGDAVLTPTDEASENDVVLAPSPITVSAVSHIPDADWQGVAGFPDWMGYTDDTLAANSMFSFLSYRGQGVLYVSCDAAVEGFSMYINGTAVDTSAIVSGAGYAIDYSAIAVNGVNTAQVSDIRPAGLTDAVWVFAPYPTVVNGTLAEEGFSEEAFQLISDLIESDIAYGFPSAQLSVVSHGRLVYENAWGRTNAYLPDGTPDTTSPQTTTDTMYDLASVTKMFAVNYALQKLITDGVLTLDDTIVSYLGARFVENTMNNNDTMRAWKSALTIRDLLYHQGGFPPDPKYNNPYLDLAGRAANPLFAGNGGDAETRLETIEAICRTPLQYEPGTQTVYSDVDYMILGVIVEEATGTPLDTWLMRTFFRPMGLTRISYNPLQNGFTKEDCAATEIAGNTREGRVDYSGVRTDTIWGEAHDEKAYYSMGGVSGHAGLFSNASDLAKLASVMLTGGYGDHRFFSQNVMDAFTSPKNPEYANWGLGWYRQAEKQRVWYFGTQASSGAIGHQGWTGTIVMIDPDRQLVAVYLTNRINSPLTDPEENIDRFSGVSYTAGTLGFATQILSIGLEGATDVDAQLLDLLGDMTEESFSLIPESAEENLSHPTVKNALSKLSLYERRATQSEDERHIRRASEIAARYRRFVAPEETPSETDETESNVEE